MSDSDASSTNVSLLLRIRQNERDPQAWRDFVGRYGRRIYEWCLNRKLQPVDAEDVTQNVLIKLARQLGTFEYQPELTFRGWLRRITENAVKDYFREIKAAKRNADLVNPLEELEGLPAQEDLATRLCQEFDLELLEIAKQRVRQRVEEHRWEAWRLTAVERMDGQEVASQLKMQLPTVYSSRYQVQKLIAEEVEQLMSSSENVLRLGR
ncbi:MAG: sigma-70 family RNA polymerase sigma factor [Planctomycetaceae bacterium]|nr:sigma-70 family RNA polymerase sigma factor [Planctomycetaceae bacterium]